MRRFINREHEIARLQQAAAEGPQLVVLRGRRRVGKSSLLFHSYGDRRGVFFQADEQPEAAHLALFAQEAARLFPGEVPLSFTSWDSALSFVGSQAEVAPLVVVLDEFQWLWQAQPSLDSIIQRHWDAWERGSTPVTLVLSGSALTLMEKLMAHSSPLYGRANYRPMLMPLDYRHAAEFLPRSTSTEEKLRRFAALGGIPQYQVWAGVEPFWQMVRNRILAKDESLFEEPLHLLREEESIRDPGSYFSIVAAIAHGANKLGEIANRTRIGTPNLSKMLARLIELGYVEHIGPVALRPEKQRGIYRLADPFFRFWFRFVFPHRSLLARTQINPVLHLIQDSFDGFMGSVVEDVCRRWIGEFAADRFPISEQIGAWWSRDGQVEIDIVGAARGKYVLLGSCKWGKKAPLQTLTTLREHQDHLGPLAAKAQLAIFACGFSNELVEHAADEGVELVTLDELYQ